MRGGKGVRTEHPVMTCKTSAGEAPDAMCIQKWEKCDRCSYPEDLIACRRIYNLVLSQGEFQLDSGGKKNRFKIDRNLK